MYLLLRAYLGQLKSVAKKCQIIVISFYRNIGCQNIQCDEGLNGLKRVSLDSQIKYFLPVKHALHGRVKVLVGPYSFCRAEFLKLYSIFPPFNFIFNLCRPLFLVVPVQFAYYALLFIRTCRFDRQIQSGRVNDLPDLLR